MKHSLLPQFTRFIPAIAIGRSLTRWSTFGLWSAMISLFILNVVIRINPLLAKVPISNNSQVLGKSTEQSQESTLQEKRDALEKEYAYWKSIAMEYPQYKDAFIHLAAVAYSLNKSNEVRVYLEKASALDPNGDVLSHFKLLLAK
jgi:hypothetical protein